MAKKIILGVFVLLLVMQFIRPTKNVSAEGIAANDISNVYPIENQVHQVLINKCYNCHSNNTHYPWYFSFQPLGWWLAHHIEEGKGELNFSEFKTYDEKRAIHKLEELVEVLEDGSMPIKSYVRMHPDSELTTEDKEMIEQWLKGLPVELKEHSD